MRRKKLYEQESEKIMNAKMTLETQAIQLESGADNINIYKSMKQGNKSLAGLRKLLGIDKVDDLMDDMREEMDQAQEMNKAIGQDVDPLLADDELLAELDALGASDSVFPQRDGRLSFPTVPFFKSNRTKEEDDFKKLEAELAM